MQTMVMLYFLSLFIYKTLHLCSNNRELIFNITYINYLYIINSWPNLAHRLFFSISSFTILFELNGIALTRTGIINETRISDNPLM